MAKKQIKITSSKNFSIQEYAHVLSDIKKHIQTTQIKALLAANKELLKLYFVPRKS